MTGGSPALDTRADVWLTAAFARYERIVAMENALRERSGGRLTAADRREVELALFRYRTDYLSAKAAQPAWRSDGSPWLMDVEQDRADRAGFAHTVQLPQPIERSLPRADRGLAE